MAFGIDLWKIVLESNCSEETERDIKIGLDDLYAKAKAFDEIENIFNNYFERYGCYPSPKEYVQEVVSVIDNYKERADDER